MFDQKTMNKFKSIIRLYRDLYENTEFVAVHGRGDVYGDIHLSARGLAAEFPDFKAYERGKDAEYPWLLKAESGGIVFFALTDDDELRFLRARKEAV